MSLYPCKICSCGVYHAYDVEVCDRCGASLKGFAVSAVETDDIPCDKKGIINTQQTVYSYKCRRCGTEYYNTEAKVNQRRCNHCGSIHFTAPEELCEKKAAEEEKPVEAAPAAKVSFNGEYTPDFGEIHNNIKSAVSQDDEVEWPDFEEAEDTSATISFTAVRYGVYSFTLDKDQGEYLLGVNHNHGEFLAIDPRVSRKHCCIYFKDGVWYVRDTDSSNGTAVNGRDIGINGVHPLNNGDLLKLGHHTDSMEFRVTVA